MKRSKAILAYRIEDDVEDEAGNLLRKLNTIPTWTKEKKLLWDEAFKKLSGKTVKRFSGNLRTYGIRRAGQHCLFDVPQGRGGHLVDFCGKRIRLVCLGGSAARGERDYLAQVIPKKDLKR